MNVLQYNTKVCTLCTHQSTTHRNIMQPQLNIPTPIEKTHTKLPKYWISNNNCMLQ